MYMYGSSSRATGKRGHGGREYRPPPDRQQQKDHLPPPLKQCDCLIELHVPEYQQQQGIRMHLSFGSRKAMEDCVKYVRRTFQCHVEIPGRNHAGPVGIVGKSLQETIPACHYVMQQLVSLDSITARIHVNVKINQTILQGLIHKVTLENTTGLLFESTLMSIAVYQWENKVNQEKETLEGLMRSCLENLAFCDASCRFQVITRPNAAFALGQPDKVLRLLREIEQSLALSP